MKTFERSAPAVTSLSPRGSPKASPDAPASLPCPKLYRLLRPLALCSASVAKCSDMESPVECRPPVSKRIAKQTNYEAIRKALDMETFIQEVKTIV